MSDPYESAYAKGFSIRSILGISMIGGDRAPSDWLEGEPRPEYFLGPNSEWWDNEIAFREKLTSGDWIALGYRRPRTPKSRLELVPSIICEEAAFGDEHSSIAGDGLVYVGVRIVAPRFMPDHPETSAPIGRPTSRRQILDAYETLKARGHIDFQGSKTAAWKLVRDQVARKLGLSIDDLTGFGEETVRKHLSETFDADKRAQSAKKQ